MTCLEQECNFSIDELFFSTTDKRGVIRSGNDVFVRVSGYSENELVSRAHSIIRHPHMPASVFRVFWDILQSGKSVAAYVKNRSKEGRFYWVMAVATPVDGGYLSVRLKPSSELLARVALVYAQVLADETAAREEGMDKESVVQIGLVRLLKEVRSLGFENYEGFMRHALTVEMTVRNQTLTRYMESSPFNSARMIDRANQPLVENRLALLNAACDKLMSQMLGKIAALNAANREFLDVCVEISAQSEVIGTVAMNAKISASTPVLEAISRELASSEVESRSEIQQLNDCISQLIAAMVGLAFDISVAALQSEISTQFLNESRTLTDSNRQRDLQLLLTQSSRRVSQLCNALNGAPNWFNQLNSLTAQLQRSAKRLRFIRMAGVTESARLASDHAFAGLFDQVNQNIVATLNLCNALSAQSMRCKAIMDDLLRLKSQLATCSENVQEIDISCFNGLSTV